MGVLKCVIINDDITLYCLIKYSFLPLDEESLMDIVATTLFSEPCQTQLHHCGVARHNRLNSSSLHAQVFPNRTKQIKYVTFVAFINGRLGTITIQKKLHDIDTKLDVNQGIPD